MIYNLINIINQVFQDNDFTLSFLIPVVYIVFPGVTAGRCTDAESEAADRFTGNGCQ